MHRRRRRERRKQYHLGGETRTGGSGGDRARGTADGGLGGYAAGGAGGGVRAVGGGGAPRGQQELLQRFHASTRHPHGCVSAVYGCRRRQTVCAAVYALPGGHQSGRSGGGQGRAHRGRHRAGRLCHRRYAGAAGVWLCWA
eukprot:ctg_3151.g588